MKLTGNELMFPVDPGQGNYSQSLTIRHYFIGMAMQGFIARDMIISPVGLAKLSIEYADALISELNQASNPNE